MEHTILASVTSILIGFVVMDNENNEQVVRRYLRDGKFTGMVGTLKHYYEFLNLTVSVSFVKFSVDLSSLISILLQPPSQQSEASSLAQLKTIKNVIDYLRNCDSE